MVVNNNLRTVDIVLGILVAAIWGSNYLLVKLGLDHLPPFALLAIRFFIITIVLLPFVPKTTVKFKDLCAIALTLGIMHHGFVFLSIYLKIDLSTNIIITQSAVPITAILSVYRLKEHVSRKTITGIVLAFCGIIVIAGDPHNSSSYMPIITSIVGALGLAIFNIQTKKLGQFNILSLIAYSSMITTMLMLIISLIFEDVTYVQIINLPSTVYISIVYMIFSTIAGFGLWFRLLKQYSASKVAPFMLLVPVFGISFTILFMHKKITLHFILGSIITLFGIALITVRRNKST